MWSVVVHVIHYACLNLCVCLALSLFVSSALSRFRIFLYLTGYACMCDYVSPTVLLEKPAAKLASKLKVSKLAFNAELHVICQSCCGTV